MWKQAATDSQSRSRLERRVVAVARATLTRDTSVSPIDVLAVIGWLPTSLVDQSRIHGSHVRHQQRLECGCSAW
ncbi:MAG TPA: hypothetical protein VIV12_31365 [Streptosporangiaceae bacterium]